VFDCIKAFSETDFTGDLKKKLSVPTLILHGDDDQIVPIADRAGNRHVSTVVGSQRTRDRLMSDDLEWRRILSCAPLSPRQE
jgi:pimeloyl-ACP methyl ester carboxylesterase